MSLRRPTIALSQWKVAVDLEATQQLQELDSTPAYKCGCRACSLWKHKYIATIPPDLQVQVKRLQIRLNKPSELYSYGDSDQGEDIRAIFHLSGRIIEGPPRHQITEFGQQTNYITIQDVPFVACSIMPIKDSLLDSSYLPLSNIDNIMSIDIRAHFPN